MTRVEFYFNVPDKIAKVSELCANALAKGHKLTVFSRDDAMSEELQYRLWQYSDASFLPSVKAGDALSQLTPVVFDVNGECLSQDDILINLQTDHPPFFSRFRVLVELVGNDDTDKASARTRFRFYRDRGYEIKSKDMALS